MRSEVQVERLLAMVPYLLGHDGVSIDEVARVFEITPRQVRNDLGVLYMCGLPGLLPGDLIEIDMDTVDGLGAIHLSNAEYLSRPLRFTSAEATTLIAGLRSLREVAAEASASAIDSAVDKLRGVAGEAARSTERVHVQVSTAAAGLRSTIDSAIVAGRQLVITYDGGSRGSTSRRRVDPNQILVRDGYAYLEAFDTERGGWRSFRLDRMAAVELGDDVAGEHPGPVSTWDQRLAESERVRLTVRQSSAWIAEYYPVHEVHRSTGELTTIELFVVDLDWLTGLLLRLGPDVVEVSSGSPSADTRLTTTGPTESLPHDSLRHDSTPTDDRPTDPAEGAAARARAGAASRAREALAAYGGAHRDVGPVGWRS